MNQTDDLIQRGLRVWTEGDLDALESMLDPTVTLRWIEPGEWDCIGRDQVMRLLGERQVQGSGTHPIRVEYMTSKPSSSTRRHRDPTVRRPPESASRTARS
jgi:hypothetical protein